MDLAVKFISLTHEGLPITEYTARFCQLAQCSFLDDEALISVYWVGANYYNPLDSPNMKDVLWSEAVLRCLECAFPLLILSPTTTTQPGTMPTMEKSLSPPQTKRPSICPSWTQCLTQCPQRCKSMQPHLSRKQSLPSHLSRCMSWFLNLFLWEY